MTAELIDGVEFLIGSFEHSVHRKRVLGCPPGRAEAEGNVEVPQHKDDAASALNGEEHSPAEFRRHPQSCRRGDHASVACGRKVDRFIVRQVLIEQGVGDFLSASPGDFESERADSDRVELDCQRKEHAVRLRGDFEFQKCSILSAGVRDGFVPVGDTLPLSFLPVPGKMKGLFESGTHPAGSPGNNFFRRSQFFPEQRNSPWFYIIPWGLTERGFAKPAEHLLFGPLRWMFRVYPCKIVLIRIKILLISQLTALAGDIRVVGW